VTRPSRLERSVPGKRAVVYLRQSHDPTGQGVAVARQKDACEALCASLGLTVVHVFTDNDISASGRKMRPDFERMLKLVEDEGADVVVAWAADRLMRQPRDLERLITLSEKRGVKLATCSGEMDLATDTGQLVARILISVARAETMRHGTRRRLAGAQRAAQGAPVWARRPYGYDRVNGKAVVVKEEARHLRWAWKELCKTGNLKDTCRKLNARGARASTGALWQTDTLRTVMLNPRYSGVMVYQGKPAGQGAWKPIFTPEEQLRLTQILRSPTRRLNTDATVKHLLSGLLICGACGAPVVGWGVILRYRCRDSAHLSRDQAKCDTYVTGQIQQRLLVTRHPLTDAKPARATATADVAELRARRDGVQAAMAAGVVDPKSALQQLTTLTKELQDAELRAAPPADDTARTLARLFRAATAWDSATLAMKRSLILSLCERVTLLQVGSGARITAEQPGIQIVWRDTQH
jgi:site-specific DNA recombinase